MRLLSYILEKMKKQKVRSQPSDHDKACPIDAKGCPIVQDIINKTDISETAVGLKGEIDKHVESVQKQINKKQKQIDLTVEKYKKENDEKIDSFERNIRKQEKKEQVDTIARTTQIGLLAVRELLRIQRVVVADPRERVGATNFDIYGIDKYFGKDYIGNCIKEIWYIEKLCRLYDKSFFDDSSTPRKLKLPDESSEEKSIQTTELPGHINRYATGILLKIQPMLQAKGLVDTQIDLTKALDSEIVEFMQYPRTLIQKTVSNKINLENNS